MPHNEVIEGLDVLVSSYTQNTENNEKRDPWMSCFAFKYDHELFGLRRYYGLFSKYKERTTTLPIKQELSEAYFGGVLFPYFGHFLIESLAFLPNIPGDAHILFATLSNTYTDWQKQFFSLYGIADRVTITNTDSYIKVKKLYKVDQTAIINCDISRKFTDHFGTSLPDIREATHQHIYLSRRHIKNAKAHNEELLEQRLQSYGITIIHPQSHSLQEQISIIRGAKVVIGIEGSAMHLLMFNQSKKKVLILKRRHDLSTNFVRQLSVQPEIELQVIDCMSRYGRTFNDDVEIDIDEAERSIKEVLKVV